MLSELNFVHLLCALTLIYFKKLIHFQIYSILKNFQNITKWQNNYKRLKPSTFSSSFDQLFSINFHNPPKNELFKLGHHVNGCFFFFNKLSKYPNFAKKHLKWHSWSKGLKLHSIIQFTSCVFVCLPGKLCAAFWPAERDVLDKLNLEWIFPHISKISLLMWTRVWLLN